MSRLPPVVVQQPTEPRAVRDALELLYRDAPDGSALAAAAWKTAREAGAPPEGLLTATRAGALAGVVWARPLPGRLGELTPPRLINPADEPAARALLDAALGVLARADVGVVQTLLDPQRGGADAARLRRLGFRPVGRLVYMERPVRGEPPGDAGGDVLRFRPYHPRRDARTLREVIRRTYQGSRDLPALDGLRRLADVVEGYQATGRFDPNRWRLVEQQGRAVGCLLMTAHGDGRLWELVYMGLVPEARGRGWGVALVRFAIRLAAQQGAHRLILAADAANQPALAVYGRTGFRPWLERVAMVHVRRAAGRGRPAA